MKPVLSLHEIALLLLVLGASDQVQHTDPDAIALQQAKLVEVVQEATSAHNLRLTAEGREILRRLGAGRG